ncbi:MAG: GIY-YIG nuclease family protein [Patescibacteria group bacterium]
MFTYVYFLLLKNNQVYTGLTKRLRERIEEHKRGKVKSTKHRRPISFIGYEAYQNENDARRRERFLKTTEGKRLFNKQYREALKKLKSIGS